MRLEEFGWDSAYRDGFAEVSPEGLEPARVRIARGRRCVLFTAEGEAEAVVAGRLADREGGGVAPVTGDWVGFSRRRGCIEMVLARRTEITRRRSGPKTEPQVLAANVDVLAVVSAFGRDFSLRRLERYLVLARQSGAAPLLVLNKVDECEDPAAALRLLRPVAEDASVLLVSARDAVGIDELLLHIGPGQTAALVGSSGVGKSTIINRLLGEQRQRVREIGEANRRGRHTTTDRELFLLPGGQLLIDTPGLRELQLWADAGSVEAGFSDIAGLARACRFRDCRHAGEPGCAVAAAVASGALDAGRLENYHRIGRELRHLERQIDPLAAQQERQRWKRIHKQHRKGPHRK